MPVATRGKAVLSMTARGALSPAAARRLGVETLPAREPSPAHLICVWVLQQVIRWLRGDLYPHLHAAAISSDATLTARASAAARKLATNQDRYHMHKVFGLACLLNFGRHAAVLLTYGRFAPADGWLAAHAALAFTSRSFHVVRRAERVSSGFLTEEVRWHALLFSLRNLSFVLMHELLLRHAANNHVLAPSIFAASALPFHLAVDAATRVYGDPGWSSIRGHDMQRMMLLPIEQAVRRMLSAMQFINNHALLFGGPQRAEIAFLLLGWVQLNAFCMTLRKKALISEDGLMRIYVLLSLMVTTGCLALTQHATGSLTAGVIMLSLRSCGGSKYWLWSSALLGEAFAPHILTHCHACAACGMLTLFGSMPLVGFRTSPPVRPPPPDSGVTRTRAGSTLSTFSSVVT